MERFNPINRRWAVQNGLPPWVGHRYGAKKMEEFLEWCLELNIPQISVYTLSTENFQNRSKREIEELFKLFKQYVIKLQTEKFSLIEKYEVRVRFIGDFKRLPPDLIRLMEKLMVKTAKFNKKIFNILVLYGSHLELIEVFKKLAKKIVESGRIQIRAKDIEKNLLVKTPVDLIIRTGGYSRLSNFLLWQAAYAEIFVTKTLWPDFSKEELIKAIKWFNSVKRKFGR